MWKVHAEISKGVPTIQFENSFHGRGTIGNRSLYLINEKKYLFSHINALNLRTFKIQQPRKKRKDFQKSHHLNRFINAERFQKLKTISRTSPHLNLRILLKNISTNIELKKITIIPKTRGSQNLLFAVDSDRLPLDSQEISTLENWAQYQRGDPHGPCGPPLCKTTFWQLFETSLIWWGKARGSQNFLFAVDFDRLALDSQKISTLEIWSAFAKWGFCKFWKVFCFGQRRPDAPKFCCLAFIPIVWYSIRWRYPHLKFGAPLQNEVLATFWKFSVLVNKEQRHPNLVVWRWFWSFGTRFAGDIYTKKFGPIGNGG